MKNVLSALLIFFFGVYVLYIGLSEWENQQTVTIFVKGFSDITLSSDQIWVGIIINGSLSLGMLAGGVGWGAMQLTSNETVFPVVLICAAAIMLMIFIICYLCALLFLY